jgi:hypothetical protein
LKRKEETKKGLQEKREGGKKKQKKKLGLVAQACNLNIREAEVGKS